MTIEKQLNMNKITAYGSFNSFAKDAYYLADGEVEKAKAGIISNMAKSISEKPKEYISAIKKSGVAIDENATPTEIANTVMKHYAVPNFAKNLMLVIKPTSSADGDDKGEFWKNLGSTLAGLGTGGAAVLQAFGVGNNSANQQAAAQLAANNQQTQQMLMAALQNQNKPQSGLSTGAIVGVAVGGLVLISLVVFLAVKK